DDITHAASARGPHHLRKNKKENQREEIIEENDGAVAERQLDVDFDQRQVSSHSYSRRLLPVSSMKASSSVGRLRWISDNSIPFSSIHFTRSIKVRAGWLVCTESFLRSSLRTRA